MLLTIDAGNTNVEFAVFEQNQLVAQWRAASSVKRTSDEWTCWLLDLMRLAGVDYTQVDRSIISCVVPSLLMDLTELCQSCFGGLPLVIGQDNLNLGIGSEVGRPEEVGSDLLITCLGAKLLYGGPALILDMGTATTLSLLNQKGNFAGVAIAPGLNLSLEALTQGAELLPQVEWSKTDKVIGTTTLSAIQGGMYWGYLGLVENLISKAKEQSDMELKVIATGGLARYVVEEIEIIDHYDQDLGLKGLQLIADANISSQKSAMGI